VKVLVVFSLCGHVWDQANDLDLRADTEKFDQWPKPWKNHRSGAASAKIQRHQDGQDSTNSDTAVEEC
jgi:hypothetical protein